LAYSIRRDGESNSFSDAPDFVSGASDEGEVLFVLGKAGPAACRAPDRAAVAVELGTECLEDHADAELDGPDNIVGFARWRLGRNEPSQLVELVKGPRTSDAAVAAVTTVLEGAGFAVAVSADRAGRIVDRLIRPQFNLALQAVDDDLATAEDLDLCLKLGLGYRRGLLGPLVDGGLESHHDISQALFEAYGQPQYAPARRAVVAKRRAHDVH
jgi:3-hydroxybutyryl-CoA dehydrogenase